MVVKNTIYNIGGLGLPLLVAMAAMPILIHTLGDSRFGILTLIWAVVSYFGLFDLGLGRALTQQLSIYLSSGRDDEVPQLVYAGMVMLAVLGLFAGFLLWIGADWGASQITYAGDREEISGSIKIMGIAMPFILLTTGLRGVLEAKGAFGLLNLIRLPMGVFTFAGPVAVVLWSKNSLVQVTFILVVGRVIACLAHGYFVLKFIPKIMRAKKVRSIVVRELLTSGGWMTVSNVVSPLMGYLDRFLIGICISTAAVAYYVTPNEMITKLWIIPSALTAVLFPKFAADLSVGREESSILFRHSVSMLFVVIFPICLFLALFSSEILSAWVGPVFSAQSSTVMQIFCFGIMVNCLAHIPFSMIQSAGQAKLTAMVHVYEFIPFAVVLYMLARQFGIVGAAVAWLARMLIDTAIMFWLSKKYVQSAFVGIKKLLPLAGLVIISFGAATFLSPFARAAAFLAACAAVTVYMWLFLVSKDVFGRLLKLARTS